MHSLMPVKMRNDTEAVNQAIWGTDQARGHGNLKELQQLIYEFAVRFKVATEMLITNVAKLTEVAVVTCLHGLTPAN